MVLAFILSLGKFTKVLGALTRNQKRPSCYFSLYQVAYVYLRQRGTILRQKVELSCKYLNSFYNTREGLSFLFWIGLPELGENGSFGTLRSNALLSWVLPEASTWN